MIFHTERAAGASSDGAALPRAGSCRAARLLRRSPVQAGAAGRGERGCVGRVWGGRPPSAVCDRVTPSVVPLYRETWRFAAVLLNVYADKHRNISRATLQLVVVGGERGWGGGVIADISVYCTFMAQYGASQSILAK